MIGWPIMRTRAEFIFRPDRCHLEESFFSPKKGAEFSDKYAREAGREK